MKYRDDMTPAMRAEFERGIAELERIYAELSAVVEARKTAGEDDEDDGDTLRRAALTRGQP